jgi:hypothetical protein
MFSILHSVKALTFAWLEVCTGQNFRIEPGPAREAFSPSPQFIFKCYQYPTQARLPFIPARMKPHLFTICPDYHIINTCL